MPVDLYAVEISPQGIDIAVRGLSPKGIWRTRCAAGTRTSLPPRRTRPPLGRFSIIVLSVPRLARPLVAKASSSELADGSRRFSVAARQSLGTTSNPVPGNSTMPAWRASASRAKTDSNTSISPVTSR